MQASRKLNYLNLQQVIDARIIVLQVFKDMIRIKSSITAGYDKSQTLT